jgi:hypothetical protein
LLLITAVGKVGVCWDLLVFSLLPYSAGGFGLKPLGGALRKFEFLAARAISGVSISITT